MKNQPIAVRPTRVDMFRSLTMCFALTTVVGGAEKAFAQTTQLAAKATSATVADTTVAPPVGLVSDNPKADPKPKTAEAKPAEKPVVVEEQLPGFRLPDSGRARVSFSGMFGYGLDPGNAAAGFEKQGRPGNVIISLFGNVNKRVSYRIAINPVNEVGTLPACSEAPFFLPNDPKFIYADLYAEGRGPQIDCVAGGNRRVDMYHQLALETIGQQGMLREAYLKFSLPKGMFLQFGRSIMTEGFTPEEGGSWTAKDAPMIQRINHEAFGLDFTIGHTARVKDITIIAKVAGVVGDGNADKDYAFNRWFQDASLDGNSSPGVVGSISLSHSKFDFRLSGKGNQTGSKIERYAPSYFGSGKHNDNAVLVSGKYKVSEYSNAVAECARYTWGLKASSALMVGSNPDPIQKNGCYFTLQGGLEVHRGLVVGASITREEIDRADSLIRYLSEKGLYGVVEGRHDRTSVIRVFVDLNRQVRIGYYHGAVSNPYPWVSGIYAVSGPSKFQGRPLDRWGMVVSFKLQ
jgi:hypothetical protein